MEVSKTSGSYRQTQRYLGTAEEFSSSSRETPRSDFALGMKGISGLWEGGGGPISMGEKIAYAPRN